MSVHWDVLKAKVASVEVRIDTEVTMAALEIAVGLGMELARIADALELGNQLESGDDAPVYAFEWTSEELQARVDHTDAVHKRIEKEKEA